MKKIILASILVGTSFITSTGFTQEHHHGHGNNDGAKTQSIIGIMQGMDINVQKLSSAIINEDYATIGSAAYNIANHDGISKEDLHKLFERLGDKKEAFIACDSAVHNLAKELSHAGEEKNMDMILEKYFAMISKTVECHKEYRVKSQEITK